MQAKEHLQTLGRAWWFIILFGVVVAGITYTVASKRPDSYKAIQTYQIQLVNRQPTSDYQYGSYYDLKGAELFTQHVMSLLRSPAVIEQIYQGAGLGYTIDNVSRFTSQFRTDVDSVQQFTVTFSRYNADEAKALANAMSTVLTEQVAQAQVDVNGSSMFRLSAFEPVVVFQETNLVLVTVTALIAGWILAMILVYLRRYLQ
jgi:capsular polysaccharide biosynthesis protein